MLIIFTGGGEHLSVLVCCVSVGRVSGEYRVSIEWVTGEYRVGGE